MKCLYYLTSSIDTTHSISDDIHDAGINDWFLHIIGKDTVGIKKHHLHSGNYIEQLDIMRDGIIGAVIGFILGLIVIAVITANEYFPPEIPNISYFFIVILLTMFCSWEGGLAGIANENKKLAAFHDDLEAGKYLILVYAQANKEETLINMMTEKHPDIHLEGIDSSFFNPLSRVQRI
jgi:hypothetical protein